MSRTEALVAILLTVLCLAPLFIFFACYAPAKASSPPNPEHWRYIDQSSRTH